MEFFKANDVVRDHVCWRKGDRCSLQFEDVDCTLQHYNAATVAG